MVLVITTTWAPRMSLVAYNFHVCYYIILLVQYFADVNKIQMAHKC